MKSAYMIRCELNYNGRASDNKLRLFCEGVGYFPVFTGLGSLKDTLQFSRRKNGPIPLGKYWIIEKPTGGLKSQLKSFGNAIRTGNNYSEWFALYRQDLNVDDYTFVDAFERGNFRLHPLRPDGSGESDGCVTFYHRFDFDLVRKALLRTSRQPIRDTNIIAFGELNVIGTPHYEK